MKKIISRVLAFLKYILIVLISILTLIVFTNFFQLKILKQEYPNFFGYSFFKVISDSMAPTIVTNDIIIVKLGKEDIKINDIITYKVNNAYVTHRVSNIKDNLYITRGDYNNVGDKPVLKENIVGKVIKTFKKLGIWKDVFSSPPVFILLVITLLLFNDSFKDWTKLQYYRYKDFRITRDSIIEGRDEKEKTKK